MIRREPTPETFRKERQLWDARMNARLGLPQRNFGGYGEDQFDIANLRWLEFCCSIGLEYLPKSLGY
jgi:hypothetical protein